VTSFEDVLRLYEYEFPEELIAQAPASPRESAKLLVHRRATGETDWTTFRDIGNHLPSQSLLVLNQTKVIPAKLSLTRSTGGTVTVLSLGAAQDGIRVLANRKLRPGEFLRMDGDRGFTVTAADGKAWLLKSTFDPADLQKELELHGTMPLPPYIKHTPLTPEELRREYQSVFAHVPGSIAAPTASLHFSESLLAALEKQGIRLAYLTLHVHLGTFAPLTAEQWQSGSLHRESYDIPAPVVDAVASAKRDGRPVIAVGTTVVRTLESAADERGNLARLSGETDLFIREGYRFRVVDGMITNFHVPKSSLLMLVSAFAGRDRVMELYRQAIERRFRLFSFGDGMLLL